MKGQADRERRSRRRARSPPRRTRTRDRRRHLQRRGRRRSSRSRRARARSPARSRTPPKIAYGTKIYDALAQALQLIAAAQRADGLDHHPHRRSETSAASPSRRRCSATSRRPTSASSRSGLASPTYNAAALAADGLRDGRLLRRGDEPGQARADPRHARAPALERVPVSYALASRTRARTSPSRCQGQRRPRGGATPTRPRRCISSRRPSYTPVALGRIIQSPWLMVVVVARRSRSLIGFAISHAACAAEAIRSSTRVGDFVSVAARRSAAVEADEASARASAARRSSAGVTATTARGGWLERLARALELADIEIDAGPVRDPDRDRRPSRDDGSSSSSSSGRSAS